MKRTILILPGTILLCSFVFFQGDRYPKNQFRSPVGYPIRLSGAFGEIRKNHLHSGIDIRTGGAEGKPVYAIADGYVQRIFVSPYGFGKALYISHPNGYTSVYGHLKSFSGAIGSWVRSVQYKSESFVQDTSPGTGILKVKKGDLIAFSGNSGSSGGPHLHFEIRDGATQEVINPLLFGIPLEDKGYPRISAVVIYPDGENGRVRDAGTKLYLPVAGGNGRYSLKNKDTVDVSGRIYFGIETGDPASDESDHSGVRSVELFIDTVRYFSLVTDRFAFSETRYVNSLMDYPLMKEKNTIVRRSYIAPGNKLRLYGRSVSNGVVSFTGEGLHKVLYLVKDVKGNEARLGFTVRSHPPLPQGQRKRNLPAGTLFRYNEKNSYRNDDVVLDLPEGVLYEDLDFRCSVSSPPPGSISKRIHLHDPSTPLHSYATLSVKTTDLSTSLRSKAVMVYYEEPGRFSSRGGKWEDGFLTAKVRELGDYAVMLDTVSPEVRPLNIPKNRTISGLGTLRFRISDELSGIGSYRGTLNGRWILMDYDAKNRLLVYEIDDRTRKGSNEFRLIVRDAVGNESTWSAVLVR